MRGAWIERLAGFFSSACPALKEEEADPMRFLCDRDGLPSRALATLISICRCARPMHPSGFAGLDCKTYANDWGHRHIECL